MKRDGRDTRDRIAGLLGEMREIASRRERKRGVLYRSGRAFLHFHEHGSEIFVDMRAGDAFERFPATTPAQPRVLLGAPKRPPTP